MALWQLALYSNRAEAGKEIRKKTQARKKEKADGNQKEE